MTAPFYIPGRQTGKTSLIHWMTQWRNLVGPSNYMFPQLEPVVIPDEVMQPLSYYNQRKAWESKYDPKFHQKGGEITVTKRPNLSSLPAKKWVLPRNDEKTREERTVRRREMLAWLTGQKFKYQVCLIDVEGKEREVFLFKKENQALMFKLAWG